MIKITKFYDKCPICETKWEKETDQAYYCVSCKIWFDKDDLWYEESFEPKQQAICCECGKPVIAYRVALVVCYWKDNYSGKPICNNCKNQLIMKGVPPKRFVSPMDRHKYHDNGRKKRKLKGMEKWF